MHLVFANKDFGRTLAVPLAPNHCRASSHLNTRARRCLKKLPALGWHLQCWRGVRYKDVEFGTFEHLHYSEEFLEWQQCPCSTLVSIPEIHHGQGALLMDEQGYCYVLSLDMMDSGYRAGPLSKPRKPSYLGAKLVSRCNFTNNKSALR